MPQPNPKPDLKRIVIDPAICHGKPVIRGTRLTVSIVVGSLAGGMSMDDVAREYEITQEDIRAALAYVNQVMDSQMHFPLAG